LTQEPQVRYAGARGADLLIGHSRYAAGAHLDGTIENWVLGMTITGRVVYRHRDGPLTAVAGDVVLIRPGIPQSWAVPKDSEPWEVLYVAFRPRPHVFPWLRMPEARKGYIHVPLAPSSTRRRVTRALKKALRLATRTPFPDRMELAMGAVEEAVLWCRQGVLAHQDDTDPRVRRALDFLTRNIGRPGIQLAEVVAASHASRARLMSLFRRQVGIPPMAYLERERMHRAHRLLESGLLRVKEVAAACGYEDAKYFSQRFRQRYDVSPSQVLHATGLTEQTS
jgi:AraC family transcriptional regulator of arabinose operon